MTTQSLLSIGQYSDQGAKTENQDSYGVLVPDGSKLEHKGITMVIADGVSGGDKGKLASETCVKSVLMDYYCTADSWTVKTAIEKVLLATNRWLCGQADRGTEIHKGMATTMSAMVVKSGTAHIFHIGDTRIYRLRNNELELLTSDHRLWVSEEKNYLTRALGIGLHLEIDYSRLPVAKGDTFIFSTDGVHEYVADKIIAQLATQYSDNLERAARKISTLALQNGSPDNVTCQIVRFDELPQSDLNAVYRKLTELPFPPDLSAGMRLDGYKVVRELSASNRAQIYLVIDEETGQHLAMKTPSVNFEDEPAYLDLFQQEEWVSNRIDNDHVVKGINQQRPKNFLYSITEYIEGQTLLDWMHDNPEPSLTEVRSIVAQIARGLQAFHRLEMIHQDLKPENVMIDQHGTVKIIDFGSTRIAGIEEISMPIERLSLLGTKNYTAPEYLLGYPCSYRADIFSLGVITYEMLTGQLPYGDKYGKGTIQKLTYTSARQWNTDIPLWVDGALKKAVHKDPDRRYVELSEFIYDLSNPNADFLTEQTLPLIERNPLGFWRWLAIISLLLNLFLLLRLLGAD